MLFMKSKILLCVFSLMIVMVGCGSDSSNIQNSSSQSTASEYASAQPDKDLSGEAAQEEGIALPPPTIRTIKPDKFAGDLGGEWITVYDESVYSVKEKNGGTAIFKGNQKIAEYSYSYKYCDDYLLNSSTYFISGSKEIDGAMHMELKYIDVLSGEEVIVLSAPSSNMYSYIDKLSDNEVTFFYNGIKNNQQCQYVMYYNLLTDELKSVYEVVGSKWESELNSSKNIWAMSTHNGKVLLLQYQLIDSKMTAFLTELTKDGDLISETVLTNLSDYHKKEYYADRITVEGSYIFVKLFSHGDLPPFSIAKLSGDKIIPIKIDKVYPCWKLSQDLIDNRYLTFDTFPDYGDFEKNIRSADIFVFDIIDGTSMLIKLDVAGEIAQVKCNNDGDFLIMSEENRAMEAYSLTKQQWQKYLKAKTK